MDPKNPSNFPSEDDIIDENDRGDTVDENEEEEVEKPDDEKAPAKKAPAKKKEEDEPDEEEEEEDEPDEEEEEDEPDEDTSGKTVALHVLKKAQAKRRAAEQRVAELERQLQQRASETSDRQKQEMAKVEARVEELYEQIEDARAEGRTKDAAKLQRELDGINQDLTRKQAAWLATKQALESQHLATYNALVGELETIDPRFDENSDEFDEDLVDRVSELTEGYESKNVPLPDALRKALRLIIGVDPFREGRKLRAEDKKPPAKKAVAKKPDLKKNLDAKKRQPPEDRGSEVERNTEVDPLKLSDEEFEKLPDATKRRLRGDFIE